MTYWLLHVTGIDTQASPFYDFWSGIATPGVAWTAGICLFLRHKNCHVKGCWRLGHADPKHGHPVCRVHQLRLPR